MIDFDEIAMKLAKAEADNEVLRKALDLAITELKNVVEDDDFDIYVRQLSAQTTLEQINEIIGANKM